MHNNEIPFFIVGSARSGTTLLRLILNAHVDVAVPPESRWITELWTGRDPVQVESFLEALAAHERFEAWDLPVDAVRMELDSAASAPYADLVRAAYRAYARLQGKSRWGDKTPRYVEHIKFLAGLIPDARFIHLVRDGRNVALSYADVPFGPKTVARAAELWSRRVAAGLDAGRVLTAGRYLELRYEQLVDDTTEQVKAVCDYLNLDFDPGMLDYTERARSAVLPRASRFNPNVTKPPIAAVRSWEEAMPPRHVEIFEAVAGPLLSKLGYPRRYPHPRTMTRAAAWLGKAGLPVGRLKHRARRSTS
jgi:Sulfotransferase family